jgi:drug/metabolite transporter (DMT)-like permease
MADTPAVSIALYLVAAIAGAAGQYFYKAGAARLDSAHPLQVLTNVHLGLGVVCYVAVMALFVLGLRRGGQLTVLYPVYATTFIWAALIGSIMLGEQPTLSRLAGIALIVAGVVLVVR